MTAPLSSTNLYGSEASAAEQSRMELQARLNGLGGLNGRQLSPEAKEAKLREACEGFESIFIQKMWQEMRKAVPQTGMLTGREERFWQDMYDQELSKSMTKAGGIGLADMMYEQLSRNLVSASRSAVGSAQGAAFAPVAAPLVPNQGEDLISPPSLQAASLYEPAQVAPENANAVEPPLTVGTPVATAVSAPAKLATDPYTAAPNTAHAPLSADHKTADLNQSSGMAMAQRAMRDAGDKLGSRAVRPARQPRPTPSAMPSAPSAQAAAAMAAPAAPETPLISQGGLTPGSPEALRAALDNARGTGPTSASAPAQMDLKELVANVQLQNQAAQSAATSGAEATPGIVRVRRTTNTPQKSNAAKTPKRASQAIRMLNVDNVGVNSRQGQGLSAYHAQQESANGVPPAANSMPAALAPLGGQTHVAPAAQEGGAAIPPLTAADLRI